MAYTINVTPTWGEWGNLFYRLAVSGERKSVEALHGDFAKAMAFAEAFKSIYERMNDDERTAAEAILGAEMKKQGLEL